MRRARVQLSAVARAIVRLAVSGVFVSCAHGRPLDPTPHRCDAAPRLTAIEARQRADAYVRAELESKTACEWRTLRDFVVTERALDPAEQARRCEVIEFSYDEHDRCYPLLDDTGTAREARIRAYSDCERERRGGIARCGGVPEEELARIPTPGFDLAVDFDGQVRTTHSRR